MTSKTSYIKDSTIGLTTTFTFAPVTDEANSKLGGMFISEKATGVMNIPVFNGEIVVVRKNKSKWEVPIIEAQGRENIQESIDGEIKKKINATGATEIIGHLSISAELNGEHIEMSNIVITAFKIDEMGEFNQTLSCDERTTQTIEEIATLFDDSPIKIEGDNVFLHIMEVAISK